MTPVVCCPHHTILNFCKIEKKISVSDEQICLKAFALVLPHLDFRPGVLIDSTLTPQSEAFQDHMAYYCLFYVQVALSSLFTKSILFTY